MRVFGTIFFGLLFAIAFFLLVQLHSFVGLPFDTGTMVGALRESGTYGAVVAGLEETVRQEVRASSPDAKYTEHVSRRIELLVRKALPEEWFYRSVEKAHAGMVQYLDEGKDASAIELSTFKTELRDLLLDLGCEAADLCAEKGASEVCSLPKGSKDALAHYRRKVDDAIDKIPESANLTALLYRSLGPEATDAGRRKLGVLAKVRWVGAGILLLLLAVVALLNLQSLHRVLSSLGLVLCAASCLYLTAACVAGPVVRDLVAGQASRAADRSGDGIAAVADGAKRELAVRLFDRGLRGGNSLVLVVLLVASAVAGVGAELSERKGRKAG